MSTKLILSQKNMLSKNNSWHVLSIKITASVGDKWDI